jgi:hypothetical protein
MEIDRLLYRPSKEWGYGKKMYSLWKKTGKNPM